MAIDPNECAGFVASTKDLPTLQAMAAACNARLDKIHPRGSKRPPVGGLSAPKVSATEPAPGVHADSPERTGIDHKAIAAREQAILAGKVANPAEAVSSHDEVYDTLEDRQRAANRKKKDAAEPKGDDKKATENPVFAHGEYDAPKAVADTAKHAAPEKKPNVRKK